VQQVLKALLVQLVQLDPQVQQGQQALIQQCQGQQVQRV
jgi:hypothetical protein